MKLKLYNYVGISIGKYLGVCQNSFFRGIRGTGPPNVNLGPPDISETTKARKLNLKIPLDMVKYSFWVQKLLHYTIQHEVGRHIDFRQMSVSPGQNTANNCKTVSAYMSLRALAMTTTSS